MIGMFKSTCHHEAWTNEEVNSTQYLPMAIFEDESCNKIVIVGLIILAI